MSTAKPNRPAPSPATPITEQPKAAAGKPPALSKFARLVYDRVKERLEREFKDFCRRASLEEQRFMIEVFNDHSGRSGGARQPGEYEIPLFSAIQRQLDNNICVVVPDDDMVPLLEEFMVKLRLRGWKRKPYSSQPATEDEIRDRFEAIFRRESELFARDAGLPSLRLMHDVLARWYELDNDPEIKQLPNVLAAATEIELDKLRAETAAEEAAKEA